jgi:hypothetical protein
MSLGKRIFLGFLAGAICSSAAVSSVLAQGETTTPARPVSNVKYEPLPPAEVSRIVQGFSTKETQFRKALDQYGFKRDAKINTIGLLGGQDTGEYRRVSNFSFDDAGHRFEHIIFFPMPTLTEMTITPEDLEDLSGVQPFALEADKIGKYDFTYVGKEKIDELNLYVFDVAPKTLDESKVSERYFKGRIWVDDRDLMIVKVRGKGVPEGKQRFPVFETYREQIDGKYWFPTYTYSDDVLVFPDGQRVHTRMKVTYTEYRIGRGEVKIIDGDVVDETEKPTTPKPAPTPTTPPKKP